MIDAHLIRNEFETVRQRMLRRGPAAGELLDRLDVVERQRRELLPRVEALKHERKRDGELVAERKRAGVAVDDLLQANKRRAEDITALDRELAEVETTREDMLLRLPNLPHESVPQGTSAADNVEVRRVGTPTAMAFAPKPHWDLGTELGIIDFERAARMSGARFAVLMGAGARMARALIDFMLDLHTREHGYVEVEPPFLVGPHALVGTGNLPKFEDDLFRIAGDRQLYLIPTAEVPLTNLHREEILDGARLPIRYTAYTPCFRSEAGSYGADVRGLIRQHQFDKVELVKITLAEQSYDELESLTRNAETVLERLGLPYRTVVLCTGDMGFASAKTYDIEVWLPSQQTYREISSCSNTEAFQARRANIRARREGMSKTEYVHTLNGSGLAIGRTLIAILENYQQADGSVIVPEALRPYMRGLEVIAR